ncbi:MAG TPA: PsbP-related protein [Nitrososphaeraceae archaeon]|jgi:serine/threonine-protein kinase|nr:PsbP-related protein [Nitrososphaeraceae archaeon]
MSQKVKDGFAILLILGISFMVVISTVTWSTFDHQAIAKRSNKHKSGNFILYNNPDYKISIQYPSKWKKSEENLASHNVVRFSAPDVKQKETKLSTIIFTPAYFGIAVEQVSKNITLEHYFDQYIKEIYPQTKDYKIVQSTNTLLAGFPARKVIMYDYLGDHTSEVMRIVSIYNATAYRIAYYAEPGKFLDYLPTAQKMVESLTIQQ